MNEVAMADHVKAQEMLLSEQLCSKLTLSEQVSVMRVSLGMSPWVDDSFLVDFQYWDSAVAKYMAQELDLESAGYRDLEPTEALEPSENPDLQSKMVSEDPCNKSLEDSLQKLKEALEELKASSAQLVNDFKEYREEIEATEQVTDSCEDCVVPLKENADHLVVNMQQDSDACNVFDKMPIEKIRASLNLGINSGSQEKLGDSPAMNSSNSGQESGERIPSWYTVCIDELASENPNSEELDQNTLGKPPEESNQDLSQDRSKICDIIGSPRKEFPGDTDRDADFGFPVSAFNQFGEEHLEDNMEVNSKPLEILVSKAAPEKIKAFDELFGSLEVRLCDIKANSLEFLARPTAQEVFDERSERGFNEIDYSVQVSSAQMQMGNWVFDPGSVGILNCKYYGYLDGLQRHFENCYAVMFDGISQETDVNTRQNVDVNASENDRFGANLKGSRNWIVCAGDSNCMMANGEPNLMPFDRGKSVGILCSPEVQSAKKGPQWDPGGVHAWLVTKLLNSIAFVAVNFFPFDRGRMEVRYGIHLIDLIEPIWMEEMMTIFENGELFMMLPVYITKLPGLSEDYETNWKGFDVTTRAEIVKQRLQWDPGGLPNVLCLNIVGERTCYQLGLKTCSQLKLVIWVLCSQLSCKAV